MASQQLYPPLRAGDIIVYDGGDTSDLVHCVTDVLSNGIQVVTDSLLTHSSMVWPFDLPINGKPQTELHVIEWTIRNGVDGCQLNPLAERVAEHTRSWGLRLNDLWEQNLNWNKLWAYAIGALGKERYDWEQIPEYILRHVPLIQELPILYQQPANRAVCSAGIAKLLRAGGIPGLNPATISPQVLAELHIYDEVNGCIQLAGNPAAIKNFNTV